MARSSVATMSSSNRSIDGSSSSSSKAMNPLSPFGHSMSHHMLVNLDSDNFLLWRLLIHPFVRGNRLDIILIGTEKCPNQVDKATGEPDPKFTSVVPSSIDTSFSVVPFPIFSIRNNVEAILKAFVGEQRVHVIDFGIKHGTRGLIIQALFEPLTSRPSRPPSTPSSCRRALASAISPSLMLRDLLQVTRLLENN
ncbi:hypothetical protein Syun_025135 [Stephania yunnanensis]|uniref:Retrotransposon Copia-like N-terminal domain-containing protein n=1 Tax=Stephania yunnanensis TaxID=152371 RepID=A0AAP0ETN9_9MAGN